MKIYTFVLGVIKSTPGAQHLLNDPCNRFKILIRVNYFPVNTDVCYFHGLTRKEGERETSKWKTKLRENLT